MSRRRRRYRWSSVSCVGRAGSCGTSPFKPIEGIRLLFLNFAEMAVAFEIIIDSTLPCLIVGHSPQLPVIRRAGIWEQWDGIVRPHTMRAQIFAPAVNHPFVVTRHFDEIGLHERHVLARKNEAVRQF